MALKRKADTEITALFLKNQLLCPSHSFTNEDLRHWSAKKHVVAVLLLSTDR